MTLSYLVYHGLHGPLGLLVNFIIFVILAVLVFWVIQWAAGEFGIPAKVVKLLGIILFLCVILVLFTGCQTAGVTLAGRRADGSVIPAHLRIPVDADHVHAHLTQGSCDLDISGLRSSPAILAQGKAAHDVENGAQGIITSGGAAFATKGATTKLFGR